ncbi:hypothetical protein BD324DRAFT_626630 [Kockovaella imperatae]|uniref:PIN domain-like protein n=1 Tax=Kockovaella imperatae TaxID=4999 RepID=A0A1Y1UF39_9TREE|nr:hypothetical protein BD324DRAFT_626630 [Kockovaella imperatae]ORX36632.1 hypothetical protein BD324DRAFT_626630 [Kockovaella imperatae]
MGVKGLWSLLNPVARPVQIESLEGKKLAIDSSIWLYQFQATMRDKDGRVLVNAHVLGFLRRINKLLFHGIKPVFVFDGGAPALKRATIGERRRKKTGAAANHAKTAEKLFAAQMRREAVKVTQANREARAAREEAAMAAMAARYDDEQGDEIAFNAIYLEDLEGRGEGSRPPPRPFAPPGPGSSKIVAPVEEPDPAEQRRKRFRKHDPYKLPAASVPAMSTEEKPDARLATEAELKHFIDEMHPSDIDVESAEFRALPTEVQYEIIGDLRVRSRQQSHRRLADMLRAAPTALDFSMAQIKHLSQRNALTQQLLEVTDMVGHAHLTIPVRIAAERNREYVLVKRGESEGGGWALGIREGTKANPIKVDEEGPSRNGKTSQSASSEYDSEDNSDYGDDIEEVSGPTQPSLAAPPSIDPDLREHRRREVLDAIAARYKGTGLSSISIKRGLSSRPVVDRDQPKVEPTANDEALALALQQEELGSDEDEADPELARALALSRIEKEEKPAESTNVSEDGEQDDIKLFDSEEDLPALKQRHADSDEDLEEVSLVPSGRSTPGNLSILDISGAPSRDIEGSEDEMDIVAIPPPSSALPPKPHLAIGPAQAALEHVDDALEEALQTNDVGHSASVVSPPGPTLAIRPSNRATVRAVNTMSTAPVRSPPTDVGRTPGEAISAVPKRSETMSKPSVGATALTPSPRASLPVNVKPGTDKALMTVSRSQAQAALAREDRYNSPDLDHDDPLPEDIRNQHRQHADPLLAFTRYDLEEESLPDLRPARSRSASSGQLVRMDDVDEEDTDEGEDEDEGREQDEDRSIRWSKSPSPRPRTRPPLQTEQSGETIPSEVEEDDGDMTRGDMVAEEDDYARFLASIKNRDLNEVRTEIDDEIRVLNAANKVAMRDSDEISQAMIAQIQTLLRHFGIPYITAPMEAEAQCAKLAELGLVDGVITDDSDVFLFGGKQCFKNIFNDAKYAECFLLSDIDRELSLTRERLISLAYLLGSDYTIGLPGVGPVVALELLANFPGEKGVEEFKTWWMKVQRGQDSEFETNTKWKKSFKKRYSSAIYLTSDWPNPLVREAYKYPTTDDSEEPFHWGFPKLSALRAFLHEELSWSISKVDDELTPIVQRIARRGKVGALNKQATLDPFFDLSVASGNYAPRRRTTANVSKRLMTVIKEYREAEARIKGQQPEGWGEMLADIDQEDPRGAAYARKGSSRRIGSEKAPSRGSLKPNASETSLAVSTQDDDAVIVDSNAEGDKPAKKPPTKRKRKSKAAAVDGRPADPMGESTGKEEEDGDGDEVYVAKAAKPQKWKKARGSRRWVGPRWDVREKPEN